MRVVVPAGEGGRRTEYFICLSILLAYVHLPPSAIDRQKDSVKNRLGIKEARGRENMENCIYIYTQIIYIHQQKIEMTMELYTARIYFSLFFILISLKLSQIITGRGVESKGGLPLRRNTIGREISSDMNFFFCFGQRGK